MGVYDTAKSSLNKQKNIADTTAGQVNPVWESLFQPTGWKRGQMNTRTSATTSAFNNTLAQQRMRSRLAGFGYEQPTEQNAETNIENARAGALARIPGDVEAESIPITMNALQGRMASGEQQGGAYGQAAGLEAQIAQQQAARRAGLWKNLFKAGLGAASPFTGGVTGEMARSF